MLFLRSFDKPEVLCILCELNVKLPMLFLPAPIILIVCSIWGSQMEKSFTVPREKKLFLLIQGYYFFFV